MKFEQVANRVCNLARLDFADWPLRAHEIVGHLEERWREGAEQNLNSEAAEQRALEKFGDPVKAAALLRRPFPYRLLIFRRYKAERLFAFLASHMFTCWVAVIEAHYRIRMRGGSTELYDVLFPSSYMFFVTGMGSFFVGAAAVAAVSVIRWSPATEKSWVLWAFSLRYGLAIVPVASTTFILAAPPFMLWRAWGDYVGVTTYPIYLGLVAMSVLAGWVGAVCMIAEGLDLPGHLSRRRNRNTPFAMATS